MTARDGANTERPPSPARAAGDTAGEDHDSAAPDDRAAGDDAPAGARTWPLLGVALAVLWLFVRGVDAAPRAVVGEFLIGLVVGLPVAFALRRFYQPRVRARRALGAAPYLLLYLLVFLRELVTANVAVAYQVLHPSMPIEPDVISVPLRVETDLAVTTIANSITLTPGTLTMDHEPETNTLYVHAISGRDPEVVVGPIRTWEDYALVIFDEPGSPGDPVPEPRRGGPHGPAAGVEGGAGATEGGGATEGSGATEGGGAAEGAGADDGDAAGGPSGGGPGGR